MRLITITVSIILLFTSSLFSQDFITKEQLCDSCEKDISVRIESTFFIKNNEYFNKYTKGFTGIGFFLKPTFEYYFTNSTKVNAGVYLLKYSGLNNFSEVIPIFSVQQRLSKNLDIVLGSLYGTLNHQIEEPLFRFDRYYQNNVEYGLQLLYNSPSIKSDTWISWEKYIFSFDPHQEEFQIGSTTNFQIHSSTKFGISVPLHFLIFHKGGQIDSSDNAKSSLFNGMSGLKFNYNINPTNILSLESFLFLYEEMGSSNTVFNSQIFSEGDGLYLKLKYKNKYLNSTIGYWQSNKFIAPKGEYLFHNISENNETYYQNNRKLLTVKIGLKHKISESISIQLNADTYYDLTINNLDHSYGLYFLINESFFISKIKNKKNKVPSF